MNVLSYLTHEENVVSLSISEMYVSIARFTQKEKTLEKSIQACIALPKGTITSGRVADKKTLVAALTQLRKKFGGSRYCIVTLPHQAIFNQVYTVPETVAPEKIADAAFLAESWRSPFAEVDAFTDSEIIHTVRSKRTLVATQAITSTDAVPYFSALESAGFVPVAAESELVAIARTMKEGSMQTIITLPHENSTDIAVFDGSLLLFARSLPHNVCNSAKELEAEQKRIIDYVEELFGKAPTKRTPAKLPLCDELRDLIASDESLAKDTAAWLPVFGALLRSRILRRDDKLNSIYPMGTEEIYEYQKFFAFTGLMGTLAALVCLVFLVAFTGMQYAARTLQKSRPSTDDATLISSARAQIAEKKASFNQVNTIISITSALAGSEAKWSENIATLRRMQIDGISITKVSIRNTGAIAIVGTARSRAHLNGYRDGLAALPEVSNATVPVTGADLRTDIPFSMTITFTDPYSVYRGGVAPAL